jgi:hypothetical protein
MVACIADEIRITPGETVYVCRHNLIVKVRSSKFILETPSSEQEFDVVRKVENVDEHSHIKHIHYYVAPNPSGDDLFTVSYAENIPVTRADRLDL